MPMDKKFNADGLIALRKKRNLTRNKVCRELEYKHGFLTTEGAIRLYEKGNVERPNLFLIAVLADYYEVKLDYFIQDKVE
mgnify:CR=1 FL=1